MILLLILILAIWGVPLVAAFLAAVAAIISPRARQYLRRTLVSG